MWLLLYTLGRNGSISRYNIWCIKIVLKHPFCIFINMVECISGSKSQLLLDPFQSWELDQDLQPYMNLMTRIPGADNKAEIVIFSLVVSPFSSRLSASESKLYQGYKYLNPDPHCYWIIWIRNPCANNVIYSPFSSSLSTSQSQLDQGWELYPDPHCYWNHMDPQPWY